MSIHRFRYALPFMSYNFLYDLIGHASDSYKGFDIVIGGSPCTYWSIAKRERETTSEGIGFELFKQFVRAVKESECKYFLYENNNSIHNDIKEEISRQLGVKPIMIDSRLVSAQGRKRCYWTNIPGVEQPEDKGILLQDILEPGGIAYAEKAYCLTSSYNGAVIWNSLERSQRTMVAERAEVEGPGVYKVEDGKVEIQSRKRSGEVRNGVYKIKLPNGLYKFRKATPIEAERLQTLPDNYTSLIRPLGVGVFFKCISITSLIYNTYYNRKQHKTL